jgi:carboxypeptidase Taq
LLSWDQETNLPEAAGEYRAEQLAQLSGWAHRRGTADEVRGWLEEAEAAGFSPHSVEGVNLREARRVFEREVRLSSRLVEEFARVSSQGHQAWVRARQQNDFSIFAPFLGRLLELSREKADCWGYEGERYDALLEGYEPGARTAEVAKLLADLAGEQSALLKEVATKSRETELARPWSDPEACFPQAAQEVFNHEVAAAFGFDFSAGRIDASAHPFCTTLGPRDVRLTTRYDERDFTNSLYSVLHEVGHGLYEQGLMGEYFGLGAGQAVSLGVHESQSRLWENKVGRTVGFWEHWWPRALELFPGAAGASPEKLARHVLRVRPSLIRVEADEVSYDLHIVLRFELERALLDGVLAVEDLPAAWNRRFEELFGLRVPDDASGCLQDIHWSMGGFGYFPTYTLGNLYSAELFAAARLERPELEDGLAKGNYAQLLSWLRGKIHRPGSTWTASELMRRATGRVPSASAHLEYLRGKYLG